MSSDLIYREDAKDFVRHAYNKGLNPIEYLDEIPAADVRTVVRGKWGVDKSGYPMIVCSECGVKIPVIAGWCMDAHINFCPNCGADMRPNLDTTKGDNHD